MLLAAGCLRRNDSGGTGESGETGEAATAKQDGVLQDQGGRQDSGLAGGDAAGQGPARLDPAPGQGQPPLPPGRREEPAGGGQQPQGARDPRVYTNRDDPFFGLPARQSPPFDFTLGPLYHESLADARSRAVHTLLSGFFQALNGGKDIGDFLHPDYRTFLLRSIQAPAGGDDGVSPANPSKNSSSNSSSENSSPDNSLSENSSKENSSSENPSEEKPLQSLPGLKSAIRNFRIGGFHFSESGEMAEAGVILFGRRGRARGEVIAEKKDEIWYISGLTVNFEDIFTPGEQKEEEEVFDPGPAFDMPEDLW